MGPWIRVLFVVPTYGTRGAMGGAPKLIGLLARALRERTGAEVRLAVLGSPDEIAGESGANFPIAYLNAWDRRLRVRSLARAAQRLRRLCREVRPDVVHSALWPADMAAALAAATSGTPHVVHLLDMRPWLAERHVRARLRKQLYRTFLRRSRPALVAAAESVLAYFRLHVGFFEQPAFVVHNGISWEVFGAMPERPAAARSVPVMGAVGRLQPEKDHATLLQAAQRLTRAGISFELRIAGRGRMLKSHLAFCKAHGLESRVRFLGVMKDLRDFYRDLDVFVLPSRAAEGLSLALLEAMATGCPVVATRVGGADEAIRDGREGLLVPPGDPDAMASALARLLRHPEERVAMGQRARERVRAAFTLEQMAQQMANVYHALGFGRASAAS